jgi:hypothetical protein
MTDVDLNVHRPSPPADEPPYRRTCLRCDAAWPCPAKRDELRAEADEMLADRARHNPQRMLDVSEIVPGCWVNWRGAENADFESEPRGGVVVTIDHIVDPETGESVRVFHTAKVYRGIRWDRLTADEVGSIDPPNPRTITNLRRAMGAAMGAYKGAVLTNERRMAEAIPVLLKAVA